MRPPVGCEIAELPEALDEWPTLCSVDATPEERQVKAAIARLKRLEAQTKAARADVSTAIVAALDAGTRQVQLVRITGYTREHIRRMAKPGPADSDTSATGT